MFISLSKSSKSAIDCTTMVSTLSGENLSLNLAKPLNRYQYFEFISWKLTEIMNDWDPSSFVPDLLGPARPTKLSIDSGYLDTTQELTNPPAPLFRVFWRWKNLIIRLIWVQVGAYKHIYTPSFESMTANDSLAFPLSTISLDKNFLRLFPSFPSWIAEISSTADAADSKRWIALSFNLENLINNLRLMFVSRHSLTARWLFQEIRILYINRHFEVLPSLLV